MEKQELDILSRTLELFLKYGIRSINMDDVARELGVSKKTLYKFVSNKAQLVDKCVKFAFQSIIDALDEVRSHSTNAIDEMFDMDTAVTATLQQKHHAVEFQLAKYYPNSFKWIKDNQRETVMRHTLENLQKGIDQGLYRSDLKVNLIAQVYYGRFAYMQDGDEASSQLCHSFEYIRESLIYHIRGIATEKGNEYLSQKLTAELATQTQEP